MGAGRSTRAGTLLAGAPRLGRGFVTAVVAAVVRAGLVLGAAALAFTPAALVAALGGCSSLDPCVQPLDVWCDENGGCPTAAEVTFVGQCDGFDIAHEPTEGNMGLDVWYFDQATGELTAVHTFTDDPTGACTSDWYGQHVTCTETCELPDNPDLLECG